MLGGAQHAFRPVATPRFVVVVAGDHGCAHAGASGPLHPTVVCARAIASGAASLAHVARMSQTPTILVNAGAAESQHMPRSAIVVGDAPSQDLRQGPAMSLNEADRALRAGVALSVSLSERAVALLAIGAIGMGAEVSAAALLRAAKATQAGATSRLAGVELLAAFGGPETGVLAGLLLGAASMRVPVILDSYATCAAALIAATLAPHVSGYLVAAHRGSHPTADLLAHLGLEPLFEVGLGDGNGTGAAMMLPFADQVAALVCESEPQ